MLEPLRTSLRRPLAHVGTLRAHPSVIIYSIRTAILPWITLAATLLLLLFLLPPLRDALVQRMVPERNFFEALGSLFSGNAQDARRESLSLWITAIAWFAGVGASLSMFWADLPDGIERAARRSRREEALADKIAVRSVRDSLRLYRSALRLATDPERIDKLSDRIESLAPLSNRSHDADTVNGRYRTEGVLSRGASGVVHRATDLALDRPIALKQLATTSIGEDDRARFCQEARALAKLGHPHIVQVFDLIEEADGLWIAMELMHGGTLAEHIDAHGRLSADETLRMGEAIADAMAFAHEQGIIHRDLKPLNVLLTAELEPKVADFGTAKLAASSVTTLDGTILGSPHTMSPEQVRGDAVDPRSDIYSLGVMLFEMLLGRPPFQGEVAAVLSHQLHSPPPAVDQQEDSPAMPKGFAELVMSMLAKEPSERPQSMHAVRERLARITNDETAGVPAVS